MRLRKVEEKDISIINQLFTILVNTLKDYIPSGADLDGILKDWEASVDSGDTEKDLPLSIPIKLESEISLGFGNLDYYVDRAFSLDSESETFIRFSSDENSFGLELYLPKIVDLLNIFGKGFGGWLKGSINPEIFLYKDITTINQVGEFARGCKEILDKYTSDIDVVLSQLKKIERESFVIWKIVREEEKLGR